MAIVKGNYTRSRQKIKATIRYITHRPTLTGERSSRVLFGYEGDIDKEQAYQMIDEAAWGTVFFRMVISPDAKREDRRRDLDLRTITRQAMLKLEERLQRQIQFIATEHNDHTDIRHIHAVVLVRLRRGERVSIKDYQALRETATSAARLQRRALDLVHDYQSERGYSQRFIGTAGGGAARLRQPPIHLRHPRLTCPDCGFTQVMYVLKSGIHWCPTCHLKLNQNREQVRQIQL